MYQPQPYPQQPYPYPPQPQQPPARRGYPVPIIAIVLAAILGLVMLCCVVGAITVALSPTRAHVIPTATTAADATPATDQPTPTLQQYYLQLLASQAPDDTITLILDAKTGAVTINDNIGEQLSVSAAVTICKARAYYLLRALYTDAAPTPSSATLRILGPASDAQGATDLNSLYARVDLSAQTAQRFNWPNLSPSSAWNVYDVAQLAPGLAG